MSRSNGSMSPLPPLRILYVTSEYAPLVKTGGLADVAGALPAALRRLGLDVRVLLPGYKAIIDALGRPQRAARVHSIARLPAADLLEVRLPGDVPAWIVDCPELYEREGGPYLDAAGTDWDDNPLRFGLLSRIAALFGTAQGGVDWQAQLIHANDWQAALAPAYAALLHARATPSVVTIHNLAYQGAFAPRWVTDLGLPAESFRVDGVEYYGRFSFLKAGLFYANAITTVSPTYATEIQRAPAGMGLEGLLAGRRDVLTGILNGIDTTVWNPQTDALIPLRYDATTLQRKAANRRALQMRFHLEPRADTLLLGVVSRLTDQKGIDLLLDAVDAIVQLPAQIVIVGAGDKVLEGRLRSLADRHPGNSAAFVGFDERLAHLVEAGADAFVMPSRFEPCGMNQMYSQRYGTPPIVHATGGLVDSVVDCTPATMTSGTATGFMFDAPSVGSLLGAIGRCVAAFRQRATWQALQRNGMARDFGWDRAAKEYAMLYAATRAESDRRGE
jgi:starch synthase